MLNENLLQLKERNYGFVLEDSVFFICDIWVKSYLHVDNNK